MSTKLSTSRSIGSHFH